MGGSPIGGKGGGIPGGGMKGGGIMGGPGGKGAGAAGGRGPESGTDSHSPDEQNVTSGLHPSWVQFQPLCLIYSLPITPTGFQRRWLACPSLALCLPSPHVPGDFLQPQLKT